MEKKHFYVLFSVALLLLFCWTAWEARQFQTLASYFPLYISLGAIVLTTVHLITLFFRKKPIEDELEDEELSVNPLYVLRYISWIVGYLGMIYVAGFVVGTGIYLASFLYFETKYSLLKTIIAVAITITIVILFGNMMNLYWPSGIVQEWF